MGMPTEGSQYTVLQLRRDTAGNWTSNNPVLNQGEIGVELGTSYFKIGDGVSTWSELLYSGGPFIQEGTPLHYNSNGNPGQIMYDSNYLYVCISLNNWTRIAWLTEAW